MYYDEEEDMDFLELQIGDDFEIGDDMGCVNDELGKECDKQEL